jgi:urease alpha subunit
VHDLVIRSGTIVDGLGAEPFTGDVAVTDGRITEIGRVDGPARETVDADGLLVTPGFVDVHTHYDGQATWDSQLGPSCWHGVTTVVVGNCGVGFAPVRPGGEQELVELMEGVDLVVTGEGRLDVTSFAGKVVGGVLEWAADAGTPHVAVIAGQVTDDAREEMAVHGGAQLLALTDRVWQSAETFSRARVLVEEAALEAGRAVAS